MLQASTLPSITDLLTRGKQAAMSGQRDLAREMLAYVVYLQPSNAEGWLWLSGVVDVPEQVRYCLERTLRIEPDNARALRGLEWLNARQGEVDEARAAAERVKPYWQTSKPKPLLNVVKNAHASTGTATGETHRRPASWTSIGLTLPNSRMSRSNAPTMPVSGATLDRITTSQVPVTDPVYREEVLAADDFSPRFVSNTALHNLWRAVQKVTGDAGLEAMLTISEMGELKGVIPEADEEPGINYTRFSAFAEAMEEFYDHAVEPMEVKVGREMFRQELSLKGKMAAMKGIQFKLMSPEKKLQTILMELADAHARMGMEAYFEEHEGGYMFVLEHCPYCYGRLTNARCNVTSGFLAAGIEWATGHAMPIEEVTCRGLDEAYCGYWIATQ
jgi:predicted hydrocarbon binding protein